LDSVSAGLDHEGVDHWWVGLVEAGDAGVELR
jgi:hypothetical protein